MNVSNVPVIKYSNQSSFFFVMQFSTLFNHIKTIFYFIIFRHMYQLIFFGLLQQNAQPEEDFIFNEKDVNYYWQEYAGRLPQEQTALAKRMQVIRLTMLNATTFEAVVENDIAAKEFTDLIPTLQGYLRKRLKNSKATMTVRVSAPTEKVRAYSRVEKFQLMAQKNNALMQLKEEFGLELY